MALPTILVNASTGSDSLASGAGPTVAITGTSGATNGAGTTVTVDAGTNISGVATDGSAVLYFADTTSGARNFAKITGISGSGGATPQFTVAEALALSASGKSWAVGGKRASIGSTTSRKLFEHPSSANGDLMPGWIIEMQSGHTETITSRITWRRAGDTTSGPVILRGAAGGTRPVITCNFDDIAFNLRNLYQQMKFMSLVHTGTNTNSTAIDLGGTVNSCYIEDIKMTTGWNKGINNLQGSTVKLCEIANTTSNAITNISQNDGTKILDCYIHDITGIGIILNGGAGIQHVAGCIIANCSLQAIQDNMSRADPLGGVLIEHNDFYDNGGTTKSAYERSTSAQNLALCSLTIRNNYFHSNGRYGQEYLTSGLTAAMLKASGATIRNNAYYNNTSGTISLADVEVGGVANASPDNANYGVGGDFSKGTNFTGKGVGDPGTDYIGAGSTTRTYVDIGASQMEATSGGGGGTTVTNVLRATLFGRMMR